MTIVGIILLVFLIYAFCGVLSFFPWLAGFLWSGFYFPIEIIDEVIYPVGPIVYIIYTGLVAFVVVSFILNLFKNHH